MCIVYIKRTTYKNCNDLKSCCKYRPRYPFIKRVNSFCTASVTIKEYKRSNGAVKINCKVYKAVLT